MPGKRSATIREPQPSPEREQEQSEPAVKRPRLEPVEAVTGEPGRPHQDFVENEARKYWQEMSKDKDLVKSTREEIRDAAMPVLCTARRRRLRSFPLEIAHRGAAAVEQYAMERRWIKVPYSNPYQSRSHIDVLIQLADDTGRLAREIPLPSHQPPGHPTMYYETDSGTGLPVPRIDSFIRGDYVRTREGFRITNADRIYPSMPAVRINYQNAFAGVSQVYPSSILMLDVNPRIAVAMDHNCWFTLERGQEDIEVIIHWNLRHSETMVSQFSVPLRFLCFSPNPGSAPLPGQE